MCGLLAGLASTLFLVLLELATDYRLRNPAIIWLLPLAGLAIGWKYFAFGKDVAKGNNLILEEMHDPKKVVPARMTPLILAGTLITHLFGGSAGREGTAVQMGASLSDQLAGLFKATRQERRLMLIAGAGAGFGSALGTPWAGVIFGMEIIHVGRLRLFAFVECLIASFAGHYTTQLLRAPHTRYPSVQVPSIAIKDLLLIALAGIMFGLMALLFSKLTHAIEKAHNHCINPPPLKPFVGGVILVFLFYIEGSYQYAGLGIASIQRALTEMVGPQLAPLKAFFTALTIGSGFKGGEFIPLVFVGTTLGSALALILPVSFQLLAAVGFAAVFAGAANAPLACTIMAMEIFGPEIGLYAFIACIMSYYFSGHHGIYKSQKIDNKKYKILLGRLHLLGNLPLRFLKRE